MHKCMYIYIYICAYIHIYTCIYICTYICIGIISQAGRLNVARGGQPCGARSLLSVLASVGVEEMHPVRVSRGLYCAGHRYTLAPSPSSRELGEASREDKPAGAPVLQQGCRN